MKNMFSVFVFPLIFPFVILINYFFKVTNYRAKAGLDNQNYSFYETYWDSYVSLNMGGTFFMALSLYVISVVVLFLAQWILQMKTDSRLYKTVIFYALYPLLAVITLFGLVLLSVPLS